MRRVLMVAAGIAAAAGLWFGTGSCRQGGADSGTTSAVLPPEADPLFPADLGPDAVDVTSYPVPQQDNYKLFVERCSLCHGLARTINSPIVDAPTWSRFVKRMHSKNEARARGPLLSGDEAKKVIAFLVFDSRERKIKRAEEFQILQSDLRRRFDREARERYKKKAEEGRVRSKESSPYIGDR